MHNLAYGLIGKSRRPGAGRVRGDPSCDPILYHIIGGAQTAKPARRQGRAEGYAYRKCRAFHRLVFLCPVDSRTTSVGSTAISEAFTPSFSIIRTRASAAICPIFAKGCFTVVRLGVLNEAHGISSKPTTETSAGICNPSS